MGSLRAIEERKFTVCSWAWCPEGSGLAQEYWARCRNHSLVCRESAIE